MTSQHLALFFMVGMNKNNYKPPLKDIKELYYRKFRGNSSWRTEDGSPYGRGCLSLLCLQLNVVT